jgi:putative nucleotidyltransferase with HDIG domain
MPTIDVSELLTRIPAQPLAARLILALVQDPEASTAQLARLVEMDPALSARVMRLANSPHYGIRSGVHSAARAVILLGVSTVRGLAAAAATTLLTDEVTLGPDDYWAHAVTVAAATSVAGQTLGLPENESFTIGLLHDIGTALFHRSDPATYDDLVASLGDRPLAEAERATYGLTHEEAGAIALKAWQFPEPFVRAVERHHDPAASTTTLTQAIILGEAIAEQVEPMHAPEGARSLPHLLVELGLPVSKRTELLVQAKRAISSVTEFFGDVA